MPPSHSPCNLLRFQIGPVQDFIAQARSTRDLWSGSYLLSWLTAVGIRKLIELPGVQLIFPSTEGQLLLEEKHSFSSRDLQKLLTPNIPNLFVARIPSANAKQVAESVKETIETEWVAIANSVWDKLSEWGLSDHAKARFEAQVARHLSISWVLSPSPDDTEYGETYVHNGWYMDAVRQTRNFNAWDSGTSDLSNEKDSLTGKEESLVGGADFRDKMAKRGDPYAALFSKHADYMGAVAIIKRVWHLSYLGAAGASGLGLKTSSKDFVVRSIRAIAARDYSERANDDTDIAEGEKYIGAIAFDGDSIGRWVSGELLSAADKLDLIGHHQRFSAALSDFALNAVRQVLAKYDAFLIYAGGDDVVALVPADVAIACAKDLRTAFRNATESTRADNGSRPDGSAGIAIAHIKSPLQDLVREAQKAEKRAKNELGRSAFSVTLMKRSGEISHWGAQWESGGVALYEAIVTAMRTAGLSAKFPHRVCQLLEPYVTRHIGLSRMGDSPDFAAASVIEREFAHAVERQGSAAQIKVLAAFLNPYLQSTAEAYFKAEAKRKGECLTPSITTLNQSLLRSVIDLCTTVAFAHRNQPTETYPAEM